MKRKLRPMGEITSDHEVILEEMTDVQDLQCGEILALVYNWIKVHRPGSIEEYFDGTNPIFYYGPKD